jgi:hypothetical protein
MVSHNDTTLVSRIGHIGSLGICGLLVRTFVFALLVGSILPASALEDIGWLAAVTATGADDGIGGG